MLRYLGIVLFTLNFIQGAFSQDVIGVHDVQPGNEPNEYTIKTTIKGLESVDIARIKYIIDKSHTYRASPNNSLFSDINESFIKFYIMAVPASGVLTIEFGVVLSGDGEFVFPVEFQYSRNEEKQTTNLPQISISGSGTLAVVEELEIIPPVVEETVEPMSPVVEDEPVVEETLEPVPAIIEKKLVVEEMPESATQIVEEILVVEETSEPVPTIVEKEQVVEEIPVPTTPIAEEVPTVEEISESVPAIVEKKPVVDVIPEPTTPIVEKVPIVEESPEPEPIVVEEEPMVRKIPETTSPSTESIRVSTKYTVQLLSLSKFSQSRLNTFCKQHNIPVTDVKKNQVGEWMKITYGEANSMGEAAKIKQTLKQHHGITDAFVVLVK